MQWAELRILYCYFVKIYKTNYGFIYVTRTFESFVSQNHGQKMLYHLRRDLLGHQWMTQYWTFLCSINYSQSVMVSLNKQSSSLFLQCFGIFQLIVFVFRPANFMFPISLILVFSHRKQLFSAETHSNSIQQWLTGCSPPFSEHFAAKEMAVFFQN